MKSYYVKYAGLFTSTYAIDTISSCFLIFHCHHQSIYWRRFPSKSFDVTQLTQDEEQSLFTIKTNMPIPMVVYGDSFQWAKYGHLILPSNLDLKSNNKAVLHRTFWKCRIDFLHTDLDGNLSSTLNPLTTSRLEHYLSFF
jgi:hypothetical protein